ncbi:MAG: chemotaxis protein CheX [Phycisphaerae bacterium]|nr:chemotaxis protein CheX [Phycisphaerae bacterium]
MDHTFTRPFARSIQNVFSMMMQLPVTIGTPRFEEHEDDRFDVSGSIGMSGDIAGSVTLALSSSTACRLVALLSGEASEPDSPEFSDAVGELVNMVCGHAKGMFVGQRISISCPSVIVGRGHTVVRSGKAPCVVIPCACDCGDLIIKVALQTRRAAAPLPLAASPA